MNKSLSTNLLAAVLVLAGALCPPPWKDYLLAVGLFALSGGVTNWLAVHMLFERVPGFYGSGVIPARFEDFKAGIQSMIMNQFFTSENLERFLAEETSAAHGHLDLSPLIRSADMNPAFDALVGVVKTSRFGGMLSMFGGDDALEPMRTPFAERMQDALCEISATPEFQENLRAHLASASGRGDIRSHVEQIVHGRLEELTPRMVKEIIQDMIREHLGWLVVWGGVCGGLIGLVTALLAL